MTLADRLTQKTGAKIQPGCVLALRAMLPTLALVAVFWSVSSWGFYALDAVITHLVLAAPQWAM